MHARRKNSDQRFDKNAETHLDRTANPFNALPEGVPGRHVACAEPDHVVMVSRDPVGLDNLGSGFEQVDKPVDFAGRWIGEPDVSQSLDPPAGAAMRDNRAIADDDPALLKTTHARKACAGGQSDMLRQFAIARARPRDKERDKRPILGVESHLPAAPVSCSWEEVGSTGSAVGR
jgi:hypothetical protein